MTHLKSRRATCFRGVLISLVLVAAVADTSEVGPSIRAAHAAECDDGLTKTDKAPPAARKAGEVVIEPASLDAPGGGRVDFELGTLYVPENRADPTSRIIGVGFARFRAVRPADAPPTFHLPGGPGSSFLADLGSNRAKWAQIDRCRGAADVVLIDQRGCSARGEVLTFRSHPRPDPLDRPADVARSTAAFEAAARDAVAGFAERGIDLRGYTVTECADDVDDLRHALGYERIALVGTSFGSQWSFAVMRRHPGRVARALLSGVEPLDGGYDMPSHVFAAVRRTWWQAEQDPRLKPYLPPGGLVAAARDVLRRLERAPATVHVTPPGGGEPHALTLGPADFQRDFLYLAAAGPAFVLSLYHGRYDTWAAAALAERTGTDEDDKVVGPSIDTSLGVTPRRKFLLQTDPAIEFLGAWNFDSYLATADLWPSPDVGDDLRTEVTSDIPVVFVHGDWDTQTPVENALGVGPFFPNGRLLIVERGGHGAMDQVAGEMPDMSDALLRFLHTGRIEGLAARVTLPPPEFAVPDFPPPPVASPEVRSR